MPEATRFAPFGWALRALGFIFWGYRHLGVTDFWMATILNIVAILFIASSIFAISNELAWITAFAIPPEVRPILIMLTVITSGAAVVFNSAFLLRLRNLGVVSADANASRGLDFKMALQSIVHRFDFIGIGAAKLTRHKEAFEAAIQRVAQNGGKARLLLCDPRVSALHGLERMAGVKEGRYVVNVVQSFLLLGQLSRQYPSNLEIRLYTPTSEDDLPPLRLMFISDSLCLASPVVLGAEQEGRTLQQLHVNVAPIPGNRPTLFVALRRSFDQQWAAAAGRRVTEKELAEIASLGQQAG
jgi:hypothetical protein